MIRSIVRSLVLLFAVSPTLLAGDLLLQNQLTLYGDVEGLNSPYRQSETLLGSEIGSSFVLNRSDHVILRAGVFADDLEQQDDSFTVDPVLSFTYFTPTTRLILGTLENENCHGYIAPLEDPLLEFNRPIEYGLQWKEAEAGLQSDWFLDWQIINTENQPEVFDYGGVTSAAVDDHLSLEVQFHGHHEGGRIYFVHVINNYVPAIGLRLRGELPVLGESSIEAFDVISCDFEGQYITGPDWGNGLYARAGFTPGGLIEIYGLLWSAQTFFSDEGDPNYNSQGLDPNYYQANRTYEEVGLKKRIVDLKGPSVDAEVKSQWADAVWGLSGKLVMSVPFEANVPVQVKKMESENAVQ